MPALFLCNVPELQGFSAGLTGIGDMAAVFTSAGFFTRSGGTPAKAGLMGGYGKLMNLCRMKKMLTRCRS
jgi:hypothetical protein